MRLANSACLDSGASVRCARIFIATNGAGERRKFGGDMESTQEVKSERSTPDGGSPTEEARREGKKAMRVLKKKPALGVIAAGGLGIVAASVIGVGEVAIAMAAGYAAYRALTS
jgi:hypothetical protein